MKHHPFPRRNVVVGAVDAHHIHAVGDQLLHHVGVVGGLARERHHDADAAVRGGRPEQRARGRLELRFAFLERGGCGRSWRRRRAADRAREHLEHGVDARKHVRFAAAKRREAGAREALLERAEVVRAKCDVMQQVARARPGGRRDALDVARVTELEVDERRAEGVKLAGEVDEGRGRRGGWAHATGRSHAACLVTKSRRRRRYFLVRVIDVPNSVRPPVQSSMTSVKLAVVQEALNVTV